MWTNLELLLAVLLMKYIVFKCWQRYKQRNAAFEAFRQSIETLEAFVNKNGKEFYPSAEGGRVVANALEAAANLSLFVDPNGQLACSKQIASLLALQEPPHATSNTNQ